MLGEISLTHFAFSEATLVNAQPLFIYMLFREKKDAFSHFLGPFFSRLAIKSVMYRLMFRQIVGGVCVTSGRMEKLGWTDRRTAEMKSESCDVQESVCVCKWI